MKRMFSTDIRDTMRFKAVDNIMKEKTWDSPTIISSSDGFSAFAWLNEYLNTMVGQVPPDAAFRSKSIPEGSVLMNSVTNKPFMVIHAQSFGVLVWPMTIYDTGTLQLDMSTSTPLRFQHVCDLGAQSEWSVLSVSHRQGYMSLQFNTFTIDTIETPIVAALRSGVLGNLLQVDIMCVAQHDLGMQPTDIAHMSKAGFGSLTFGNLFVPCFMSTGVV